MTGAKELFDTVGHFHCRVQQLPTASKNEELTVLLTALATMTVVGAASAPRPADDEGRQAHASRDGMPRGMGMHHRMDHRMMRHRMGHMVKKDGM
jgi:hypothetical protein